MKSIGTYDDYIQSQNSTQGTGGQITPDMYDQLRTLVGTQILQHGGKVSEMTSALDLLKPTKSPEDEKADQVFAQRLAVLEHLWFSAERDLIGKGGSQLQRTSEKLQKWFASSEAFNRYNTYKTTLGATLAKKAGDTGNIAYQEQLNQLNSLPVPGFNTKTEGEMMFKQARAGYGVAKEAGYYNQLRRGELPPEIKSLDIDEVSPTDVDNYIQPKQINRPTQKLTTQIQPPTGLMNKQPEKPGKENLAEMSVMQRLLGTQQDVIKPNLPFAGAGTEAGAIAGSFSPGIPGIRTLIGGGIGQAYEKLGTEGIPLTGEARERMGYTKPTMAQMLGGLAGPIGIYATNPKLRKDFNEIGTYALMDALFNIKKLTGGGVDATAQNLKSQGVKLKSSGVKKPVTEAINKYVGKGTKEANTKIKNLNAKYPGKALEIPKAVDIKRFLNQQIYNARGNLKTEGGKLLKGYEARALEDMIHGKSKLIGILDKLYELASRTGRVGDFFGKTAATAAVGAGAAYGVSKAAGGNQ